MKTVSNDYNEKDIAIKRQPVELYHFWIVGGSDWRYTSGDTQVTFDGNDFTPAVIERGSVVYNEGIASSQLDIRASHLQAPIIDYLITNPLELVWVEVIKLFRDQDPLEGSTIFVGMIKNVAWAGNQATVQCTGFEHFLKKQIPRERYQPSCNYFLYSDECGIDKTLFQTNTTLTAIDSSGMILTSTDFGLQSDNYFAWGYLVKGDYKRMIVEHAGNLVTMRYPIPNLTVGDAVTIYAGCNKKIETCNTKFDNILEFGGFNEVPLYNPVLWS